MPGLIAGVTKESGRGNTRDVKSWCFFLCLVVVVVVVFLEVIGLDHVMLTLLLWLVVAARID